MTAFEKVTDRKSFEDCMIKFSQFMKEESILDLCKELAIKFPKTMIVHKKYYTRQHRMARIKIWQKSVVVRSKNL